MTIAVDPRTNEVLGQVAEAPLEEYVRSSRYALTADDVAHGYPKYVRLLTAAGYQRVLRASVRLEEV